MPDTLVSRSSLSLSPRDALCLVLYTAPTPASPVSRCPNLAFFSVLTKEGREGSGELGRRERGGEANRCGKHLFTRLCGISSTSSQGVYCVLLQGVYTPVEGVYSCRGSGGVSQREPRSAVHAINKCRCEYGLPNHRAHYFRSGHHNESFPLYCSSKIPFYNKILCASVMDCYKP